jgi:hypothetical protein
VNDKDKARLRLDPKSCPKCKGSGYYSTFPTPNLQDVTFKNCNCPFGKKLKKSEEEWLKKVGDKQDIFSKPFKIIKNPYLKKTKK